MNSFFDCLWWWRQEFRGQRDPFALSQGDESPAVAFPEFQTWDENYFSMLEPFPGNPSVTGLPRWLTETL